MPVFTFEKISPPIRRVPASTSPADEKPRSVIVQILDRLVDARGKRANRNDKAVQKQLRKSTSSS